jgi:putative chitinase
MTPQAIEETLIDQLRKEGFDKNTFAMIGAQCQYESGDFKRLEESFAYKTPDRLMQVFSHYFLTLQNAENAIKLGAEEIANIAYSNRMGNGNKKTGDGYKYRGRGLIMITGRGNYALASVPLKLDLIENPDLALDPLNASRIAINYFKNKAWLMKAAQAGCVLEVSSWINLGYFRHGQTELPLGYHEREHNFNEWLKKF